jgi:hypothetical protein
MSHVVEIALKIKDLATLRVACDELGLTFKENQRTYKWFGKWVGDSPMPEGMTTADLGKCEHAISVPGCNYEVGVRKHAEGHYSLTYDWWNSGGLRQRLGQNAGPLVQSYAKHKSVRELRRKGFRMAGTRTLKNGAIEVEMVQ